MGDSDKVRVTTMGGGDRVRDDTGDREGDTGDGDGVTRVTARG